MCKVAHQGLCRRRSGPADQRDDHGDGRDQPCGPFCPLGGRRPQLPNPSALAVRCVSLAARAAELGRSCSHLVPPSYVWLLPRPAPVDAPLVLGFFCLGAAIRFGVAFSMRRAVAWVTRGACASRWLPGSMPGVPPTAGGVPRTAASFLSRGRPPAWRTTHSWNARAWGVPLDAGAVTSRCLAGAVTRESNGETDAAA